MEASKQASDPTSNNRESIKTGVGLLVQSEVDGGCFGTWHQRRGGAVEASVASSGIAKRRATG